MIAHKRMLVLANSVKKGSGRCIAGREVVNHNNKLYIGSWIRPVSNHGEGELWPEERLYKDGREVAVLDFARVPISGKGTNPCQPENWVLRESERWDSLTSVFSLSNLSQFEERPADLWLQRGVDTDRVDHDHLLAYLPRQSLYLIRPQNLHLSFSRTCWDGITKTKRRCTFFYNGAGYNLGLTDPVISHRYESQIPALGAPPLVVRLPNDHNLLICVSLAGAFNGVHYKLVATVFEGV